MKKTEFPYWKYINTPPWEVIEQAIQSLVENRDIVEITARCYIVGFIVKALDKSKLLKK